VPVSSRAIAALGWLLAALSLTAFLILAIGGPARHGAVPSWDPARFSRLKGTPAAAASRTWMVAINPGCPHCRASLPQVAAEASRAQPAPALAVLLVDTTERPSADSLEALPAATVWWDSAGVWRRIWRRSAYGEVLVFGATGRLIEARPPVAAP
jgi:hypothetical protein